MPIIPGVPENRLLKDSGSILNPNSDCCDPNQNSENSKRMTLREKLAMRKNKEFAEFHKETAPPQPVLPDSTNVSSNTTKVSNVMQYNVPIHQTEQPLFVGYQSEEDLNGKISEIEDNYYNKSANSEEEPIEESAEKDFYVESIEVKQFKSPNKNHNEPGHSSSKKNTKGVDDSYDDGLNLEELDTGDENIPIAKFQNLAGDNNMTLEMKLQHQQNIKNQMIKGPGMPSHSGQGQYGGHGGSGSGFGGQGNPNNMMQSNMALQNQFQTRNQNQILNQKPWGAPQPPQSSVCQQNVKKKKVTVHELESRFNTAMDIVNSRKKFEYWTQNDRNINTSQ
jgi:hypothetical protein